MKRGEGLQLHSTPLVFLLLPNFLFDMEKKRERGKKKKGGGERKTRGMKMEERSKSSSHVEKRGGRRGGKVGVKAIRYPISSSKKGRERKEVQKENTYHLML